MIGKTKVIVATGITGCGRKEYLDAWEKYSHDRGKKVRVFHVGDLMFEYAERLGRNFKQENILHARKDTTMFLRSSVAEQILHEVEKNEFDAVVICIHGCFFWTRMFKKAVDRFLKLFFVDMFVTFIEDYRKIEERLDSRPQWEEQKITAAEVLGWQNVEVIITDLLAEFIDPEKITPFFVVPTMIEDVQTFYKLVFHPELEPIYVAMPISHFREPEQRQKVDEFIQKLQPYFTVFNPLTVEVVGAVEVKKNNKNLETDLTVHRHIVFRDVEWFIGQVKIVIAYRPKAVPPKFVKKFLETLKFPKNSMDKIFGFIAKIWPEAVPSPGMEHECSAAFYDTKDVWVVQEAPKTSPFVTSYNTEFFTSIDALFEFLRKKYPDRGKNSW